MARDKHSSFLLSLQ